MLKKKKINLPFLTKKLGYSLKNIRQTRSLGIAVSGGQDSISLLFNIFFLKSNYRISLIHCNHLWQENSTEKASKLEMLAKQLKVPYFEATTSKKIQNEEQARLWRYKVISQIGTFHNYHHIFTGHTASDAIETKIRQLFLKATRLKNNQKTPLRKRKILIILSPLKFKSRLETKNFCQKFKLPLQLDQTNNHFNLERNRIRREFLPYIRYFLNRRIDENLYQIIKYGLGGYRTHGQSVKSRMLYH